MRTQEEIIAIVDDIAADTVNVWASRYRFRGDRRNMKGGDRSREQSHVLIQSSVCVDANDERAEPLARAMAETLARFGF